MRLLRLSDAIKKTGDTPGLPVPCPQLTAVTAARRSGHRAIPTLTDGTDIPVSHRNIPDIRKAGLLPA